MTATFEPNATVRSVHSPVPLQQFTLGYHPTGFIAEQAAPPIKVTFESDLYYKWNKGQAFRVERSDGYGSARADKTRPRMLNYGFTQDSYTAMEFAMEISVSDREKQNADSALNLAMSKVRRIQDEILLDQEIRVASIFTTSANYASANKTTNSGTGQWNNASFASQTNGQHSVIKQQFETAKEAVRASTGGLLPNTCIIPRSVAAVMYNDVGLADLVKYNQSPANNLMTNDFLPDMLWGMKVYCPTVVKNTAVEGDAYSGSDVWGKHVWIGYINPNPGLDQLTFATIFRVRDWGLKQYRDEFTDSDIYRPSLIQAEKLVAADCGYLIINAIA